ncbi:MAG: prolipoprotein diacylglyceryl transferase [Pirellulales bacterium]|nr:prolipoprotein diacylglyceryl transferase [Pirellulales bacterium]
MHPILFHIPREVFGVPLFGWGLLLALWAVFGAGLLIYVVRKQGWTADTWGYLPSLAVVAAVLIWVLPTICDAEGLPIRGYGVLVLCGVLAGTGLGVLRARRVGLSPDLMISLAFWTILPGIVAARLFYVVEYWQRDYLPVLSADGFPALLVAIVNLSQGGLVIYGAFLGAMAGLFGIVRTQRLSLLAVLDLVAPCLMLGMVFGRIGCLMAGCCFGGLCVHGPGIAFPPESPPYLNQMMRGQFYGFTLSGNPNAKPEILDVRKDSPAAQAGLQKRDLLVQLDGIAIPNAGQAYRLLEKTLTERRPLRIEVQGRPPLTLPAVEIPRRSLPVHPTQIYSSLGTLLLCLLLLAYDPFHRRDGELFALMVSVYAVNRFLIEILRTDEPPIFGTGMSIAQNISLVLLLLMAGFWWYLLRRPPGLALARKSLKSIIDC